MAIGKEEAIAVYNRRNSTKGFRGTMPVEVKNAIGEVDSQISKRYREYRPLAVTFHAPNDMLATWVRQEYITTGWSVGSLNLKYEGKTSSTYRMVLK